VALLPDVLALPEGPLDLRSFRGRWSEDLRPHWLRRSTGWVRLYALAPELYAELRESLQERQALRLPVLPPIRVVEYRQGALVLAESAEPQAHWEASVEGQDEWLLLRQLLAACESLVGVLSCLHRGGWLWTCFDPQAIEITHRGLRLRNLDLLVPRPGRPLHHLDALPAFAAPERVAFDHERLSPATDVFSLAAFLYYHLIGRPEGFPGHGPAAFDYDFPPLRIYRPWLPLGIEPVLRRALHPDPLVRPATPTTLVRALHDAVAQAHTRYDSTPMVAYDVAGGSRIGRYHVVTQTPNQDRFVILPSPERLVVAVADGVTHALIGTGHLASETAITSLRQTFQESPASEPSEAGLSGQTDLFMRAFDRASRAIFERSLQEPLGRLATDPSDLMSSTALVGLLQGRQLLLGNAGDSRAYLIRQGVAEQLTVDGDLRTLYLRHGTSPEEVASLGGMGASLYRCLGVAREEERARLTFDAERCQPDLSVWPLLPGDTLVLCTDGLVEEGVFLSPDDLPSLVETGTVAEVVERLIDAACAVHRDPSPAEPEGCGDDVTCIVIRVLPAPTAVR
jgi:protein phosphatase